MKRHPILLGVAVAGAAFVWFGPLDAYAGTGRLLMPFISPTTYVNKVRNYAGLIGVAAGVGAYLLAR